MFVYGELQLSLGGADGLVDALHAHGRPLAAQEAAGRLFALRGAPRGSCGACCTTSCARTAGSASSVRATSDSPAWAPPAETPLEDARFCVVDLETTGVGRGARIVEIGAVRIERLEVVRTFERLVDPGVPLPPLITSITGIRPRDLTGAGPVGPALRELLRLAEGCRARRPQRALRRRLPAARARRDRRAPARAAGARHGRARPPAARRPGAALRPARAGRPLLAADATDPPGAARCARDGRAARAADRHRPGARCAHRRGRARPRRRRAACRAGPPAARRARPGRAGRLHPARRARERALRRQGGRPPHAGALVLRHAPPEAGARGRARRARADRRGAARQRARGLARRARADPRLAAARELAQHAARARPLPAPRRLADPLPTLALRDAPARRRRPVRGAARLASHRRDGARGAARLVRAAHLPAEAAGRRGHVPARASRALHRAVPRRGRGGAVRGRDRTARALPRGARGGRARRAARAARPARRGEPVRGGRAAGRRSRRRSIASTRRSPRCVARARAAGCCWQPTSIRRSSAVSSCATGVALGWRTLPRRGDPSAVVGSALHELARPLPAGDAAARGPWLPADEAEAAAILAAAFAGRAPGVVPIATPPQTISGSCSPASPRRAPRCPSARRCGARIAATGVRCTSSSPRRGCST